MQLSSGADGSLVSEVGLAQDTGRVQNVESAVPQPGELGRIKPGDGDDEVGVADDLSDGPGKDHGRVSGRSGDLGERVDDEADEEDAREDLEDGGEEGCADDAC